MSGPNIRPPSFVRRHLATNVESEDVLIGLACDESLWVRREAADNPRTPSWIIDLLVRAGADPQLRGRAEPDRTMPPDDLRRLVECGPWARQLVAEHPNATVEILDVLATLPGERLRAAVAAHPNTAPATLARLCADSDVAIRVLAASRPDAPSSVVLVMCRAGATTDLSTVAGHPNETDLEAHELAELAALGAWGRFLAARIGSCPTGVLDEVAVDADWRIRSAVLDNPHTPTPLLAAVAGASSVAEVELLRFLSSASPAADVLGDLAGHERPEVRLAIARHPAADARVLGALVVDRVADIRRTAAQHLHVDHEQVALLVRAGSTDDLVRLAPPDPEITPTELDLLSRGGYWARQLSVRHPDTPPTTLAHLLCDDDPKLREWAAAHPRVPRDVVELLLRAGAATDFQGIAPPEQPDMSHADLRTVAGLGPYGRLVVSWHPNAPTELRAPDADPWC